MKKKSALKAAGQTPALTYTIPTIAGMLGISRAAAYLEAQKGEINGVKVLKFGRSVRVPKAPFDRAMGISGANGS